MKQALQNALAALGEQAKLNELEGNLLTHTCVAAGIARDMNVIHQFIGDFEAGRLRVMLEPTNGKDLPVTYVKCWPDGAFKGVSGGAK